MTKFDPAAVLGLPKSELLKAQALVNDLVKKASTRSVTQLTEDQAVFYGVMVQTLIDHHKPMIPQTELYTRHPTLPGFRYKDFTTGYEHVTQFITSQIGELDRRTLLRVYRIICEAVYGHHADGAYKDRLRKRANAVLSQLSSLDLDEELMQEVDSVIRAVAYQLSSEYQSVGIKTLTAGLMMVEDIIEEQFPGYLASGMLVKIARSKND